MAVRGQPEETGYLKVMLLAFYGPTCRRPCITDKDGTFPNCDDQDSDSGGDGVDTGSENVICTALQSDDVLVLVAAITESAVVRQDLACGIAFWDDRLIDGRKIPDISTFLLDLRRDVQPVGAAVIPVINFGSGKQTGVAAHDRRGGYDIRSVEGLISGAVEDSVIDTLTKALVDYFFSQPGSTSLGDAITALEDLEPRNILLALINAAARAIATHAGLGAIAPLIGQFAEGAVSSLLDSNDEDKHPLAAKLNTALEIEEYVQSGSLAEGVVRLLIAPAAESALKRGIRGPNWVPSGYEQRLVAESYQRADRPDISAVRDKLKTEGRCAGDVAKAIEKSFSFLSTQEGLRGTLFDDRRAQKDISDYPGIGPAIGPAV